MAPSSTGRKTPGTEMVARLQSPADGLSGLEQGQTVSFRFAPGAVQVLED